MNEGSEAPEGRERCDEVLEGREADEGREGCDEVLEGRKGCDEVLEGRGGDEGREVLEGREMLADREGGAGREVLEGEAAECSKVANAMKASKIAKAMNATKGSKDAENMTPLFGPHGGRAFEQGLERDYPIKDLKEQVETFGATSTDATEWEAIPLLAFFENGGSKGIR